MSRSLFWLSGDAWTAIEPHLPKNQPGARRVDDRRVISGIIHIAVGGGRMCQRPTDRPRRSITAGTDGAGGGYSSKSWRALPGEVITSRECRERAAECREMARRAFYFGRRCLLWVLAV
jgi:transposase